MGVSPVPAREEEPRGGGAWLVSGAGERESAEYGRIETVSEQREGRGYGDRCAGGGQADSSTDTASHLIDSLGGLPCGGWGIWTHDEPLRLVIRESPTVLEAGSLPQVRPALGDLMCEVEVREVHPGPDDRVESASLRSRNRKAGLDQGIGRGGTEHPRRGSLSIDAWLAEEGLDSEELHLDASVGCMPLDGATKFLELRLGSG